MAIGTTAAVLGGASLLGGIGGSIIGGNAARDAARTQAGAADRATQLQYEMYRQQRDDQAPWRAAGAKALAGMDNEYFQRDFSAQDFEKDPGYAFRMAEGQKALERSAAARGGLMSGGFMKGLTRYGQDVASQEYGNAYNRFNADRDRRFGRLSTLAGFGNSANQALGQAGMNYANQSGQNMMGAANAAGAAGIAQANLWGNQLSGLGNNIMNYSLYSKMMDRPETTQQISTLGSSSTGGGSALGGYNYNQSANDFWGL